MNRLSMTRTGGCLLRKRPPCSERTTPTTLGTTKRRIATPFVRKDFHSSSWVSKADKKNPKLGTTLKKNSGTSTWYTSSSFNSNNNSNRSLDMGRYGLKRLEYATTEGVPLWTAPPHPPTKTMAERVVFPTTIAVVAGIFLWVYTTPEEDDMTEYWKKVESGRILLDDDDDDDWDDDDDDDEE